MEVFVVDNDSVDGSVAMTIDKFPEVKVIPNKKNVGFSSANNQAIKEAAEGPIRAQYAEPIAENAVHGYDGPDTDHTEIAYFFQPEELCERTR